MITSCGYPWDVRNLTHEVWLISCEEIKQGALTRRGSLQLDKLTITEDGNQSFANALLLTRRVGSGEVPVYFTGIKITSQDYCRLSMPILGVNDFERPGQTVELSSWSLWTIENEGW